MIDGTGTLGSWLETGEVDLNLEDRHEAGPVPGTTRQGSGITGCRGPKGTQNTGDECRTRHSGRPRLEVGSGPGRSPGEKKGPSTEGDQG